MADVEKSVPPGIKFDFFGFGDLFAFKLSDPKHWIIQVGPIDHAAAKRAQIAENEIAQRWLMHGHGISLALWRVRRPKIGRRSFEFEEETVNYGKL